MVIVCGQQTWFKVTDVLAQNPADLLTTRPLHQVQQWGAGLVLTQRHRDLDQTEQRNVNKAAGRVLDWRSTDSRQSRLHRSHRTGWGRQWSLGTSVHCRTSLEWMTSSVSPYQEPRWFCIISDITDLTSWPSVGTHRRRRVFLCGCWWTPLHPACWPLWPCRRPLTPPPGRPAAADGGGPRTRPWRPAPSWQGRRQQSERTGSAHLWHHSV